jgi:integrase
MAKVRARPDNGLLFLDFYYRGVRCREQTALRDSPENRKKVQAFMNRIQKDISQGSFDYAATFPGSLKASRFAQSAAGAAAANAGNPVALTAPTFADFSMTWRAEMAPQWRPQHRAGADDIFKKHLLPAFGEKPLSQITKADVLTFRASLTSLPGRGGRTMSGARINKIMSFLRQMLNEASERFQIAPAFRGIKPLKSRRPDVQPFSLEEVERIRATIRADYRHYITVRFFTGMRTGEVNGLKWKYVDFERGLILVRETLVDGESDEHAKTEQSIRDIPMLPVVREALEAHHRERNPDNPFVFGTRTGGPIDAHNFANRVWYPLLRYLELEKRRPYQTRHTTATLMLASGENPEWIAKLMGHANTQMLFTVYSRFVPNLTRQDGRAITGLLNSRHGPAPTAAAGTAPPPASDLLAALKSLPPETLSALLQHARSTP